MCKKSKGVKNNYREDRHQWLDIPEGYARLAAFITNHGDKTRLKLEMWPWVQDQKRIFRRYRYFFTSLDIIKEADFKIIIVVRGVGVGT